MSTSGLHLAFYFVVGKLLHFSCPLLFKLQPLDPILHALQLGSLLNHLIVIVEHAEAFFVYAALATHRSRYLRGGHGSTARCNRQLLVVTDADGRKLLCVNNPRVTRQVLAEFQRLHASLTLRLCIAGIDLLIISANVGQLRNSSYFSLHPILCYLVQIIRCGCVVLKFVLVRWTPITTRCMLSKLRYGSLTDCRGHSHFLRSRTHVVLELLLRLEVGDFENVSRILHAFIYLSM